MSWRRPKDWGTLLLSIWLILFGAIPLLRISFAGADLVLPVLAIAAGICLLLDR